MVRFLTFVLVVKFLHLDFHQKNVKNIKGGVGYKIGEELGGDGGAVYRNEEHDAGHQNPGKAVPPRGGDGVLLVLNSRDREICNFIQGEQDPKGEAKGLQKAELEGPRLEGHDDNQVDQVEKKIEAVGKVIQLAKLEPLE